MIRLILLIMAAAVIVALFSCKNTHEIERTITYERDTTIILPGATVYDTLNFRDSIFINSLTERIVVDSSARAELRFYKDELGRIIAQCNALPDTIYVPRIETIKEIKYLPKDKKEPTFNKWGTFFLVGLFILMVIAIVLNKIFK